MNETRYRKLNANPDIPLTPEELKAGWCRCWCEWDGLLINVSQEEAEFCTCLKNGTTQ